MSISKIQRIIRGICAPDPQMFVEAQRRLDSLTKPKDSLGKLEKIAKRVVAITASMSPSVRRKVMFLFAADHGVAEEGVSAYPQQVTLQMVHNFLKGGAAINILAEHIRAEVVVTDAGVKGEIKPCPGLKVKKVGWGTDNMAVSPAMGKEEVLRAVEVGIEVFEEEQEKESIDIAGLGDMGIANTTSSSAILAAITGKDPEKVTGRGTGVKAEVWQKKVEIIKKALQYHHPDAKDPVDVLSKVGGYEIGAMAGCILAAAAHKLPVVIDGFISTAAALIAAGFCPGVRDYMFASHLSVERGHKTALDYLKLSPLLDLNLRLGEGTGAALAISVIEASVKLFTQMAIFEEAGVSKGTD